MFAVVVAASPLAIAGEGGMSHVCPAPMPRWWTCRRRRPDGSSSRCTSTTRATPRQPSRRPPGVVANTNADVNTLVLGGGYGFEQTVLGGAPLQRRRVPALLVDLRLREHRRARRHPDREQGVRHRRPDDRAGAAGLEVRRLAVRLPDAGLRADRELRGRPARQHRASTTGPSIRSSAFRTAMPSRASTRRSTSVTR